MTWYDCQWERIGVRPAFYVADDPRLKDDDRQSVWDSPQGYHHTEPLDGCEVLVAYRADEAGAPGSGEDRDLGREACYPAGIPPQLGWVPAVPCRKGYLAPPSASPCRPAHHALRDNEDGEQEPEGGCPHRQGGEPRAWRGHSGSG
ncbi:Hypothetical predicted protein [Mytilus galloprovincialis]|uniref:Uncharacterized protein n=1 Tax=Mytilus galloprovincialis TaxID=29158 RepID=A0A8B6EU86_MYTGA|nr:Hypothetical predicted protein [Mytilus galloprovincialis]